MATPTKRIGYVDYQLDNFHANTYLAAIRGPLVGRGYDVAGATAMATAPGREWADRNRVRWFETPRDMAAHVDCFAILAPSDPQVHLGLCEQVLPFGKPTFVDKTFAPNFAIAEKIFKLADEHRAAVQTTSALRATEVQRYVATCRDDVQSMHVWAGGSSLGEYIIHPLELLISCLGPSVIDMMRLGLDTHPQFVLKFAGGRTGVIDFAAGIDVDFAAAVTTLQQTKFITVDCSRLFIDAAAAILDFFDAAKPLIDRRETLTIHRILEMVGRDDVCDRFQKLAVVPPPHFQTSAAGRPMAIGKAEGQP